jgi:hypothetical protein
MENIYTDKDAQKDKSYQINENHIRKIVSETLYDILNESRGLNSMKLYQIAKEHGGLKPRYYTSTRYFNELTDNDVIGIVEKPELNRYENASWPIKAKWANEKGYKVNRGDNVDFIPMADYTWVAIIERGSLLPDKEWEKTPHGKKVTDRAKHGWAPRYKNNKVYHYTDENERGFSKRAHDFNFKKIANDERIYKNNLQESINNEVEELGNYIIEKYYDELIEPGFTLSAFNDIVQDAYIELYDRQMDYNDKQLFRNIRDFILDKIY